MNKQSRYIIAIFAISLLLGLSYVVFFPQFELSVDALEYDSLGWNLAQGNGYKIEQGSADITREPAYPLFLATIYSIFGHNYLAVRIIQAVVNAFTCLLIYFIGRQTLGLKPGLIAAFIAAIYPAFIAYTGYILTETLFTFLLALVVLILIKAIKQGLLRWYVISGLLMGIAILCKAVVILFPLFIFALLPFFYKVNRRMPAYLFCMILVTLLAITPWTVRNYRVFGAFVPIKTGTGFNLWLGSYLPWNGKNMGGRGGYPEVRVKFIKTEPLGSLVKNRSPIDADNVMMREAIGNIKDNPIGYIKLSLKRIPGLWIHPIGEELIKKRSPLLSEILVIFHYIMLSLSLGGIVLSLRNFKTYMPIMPMILVVIYFTAIYSMTYAHPRYHFPALPYVILFMSFGLLNFIELTVK